MMSVLFFSKAHADQLLDDVRNGDLVAIKNAIILSNGDITNKFFCEKKEGSYQVCVTPFWLSANLRQWAIYKEFLQTGKAILDGDGTCVVEYRGHGNYRCKPAGHPPLSEVFSTKDLDLLKLSFENGHFAGIQKDMILFQATVTDWPEGTVFLIKKGIFDDVKNGDLYRDLYLKYRESNEPDAKAIYQYILKNHFNVVKVDRLIDFFGIVDNSYDTQVVIRFSRNIVKVSDQLFDLIINDFASTIDKEMKIGVIAPFGYMEYFFDGFELNMDTFEYRTNIWGLSLQYADISNYNYSCANFKRLVLKFIKKSDLKDHRLNQLYKYGLAHCQT